MSGDKWYVIDGVNPQPWAIGPLGIGRKQGGKWYPFVGPNQQLKAFQLAIKEELGEFNAPQWDGDVCLEFFFWRQIERYTGVARKVSSHISDATNMQKGLEDALQGVFFQNDRQVRDVRSVVVEQTPNTEPRILVHIYQWAGLNPDLIPKFVWDAIDHTPKLVAADNDWSAGEDAF